MVLEFSRTFPLRISFWSSTSVFFSALTLFLTSSISSEGVYRGGGLDIELEEVTLHRLDLDFHANYLLLW